MALLLAVIFCAGYLGIILEHPLNINKAATALITGVLCWVCLSVAPQLYTVAGPTGTEHLLNEHLNIHLIEAAQILFFLLGAMTVVELVDAHQGFAILTSRITTNSLRTLLFMVAGATFILSAVLDNLTTAIVMTSLIRKPVPKLENRLVFAAVIIIAANSGGAFSPIGDVTTTMLWTGGQITAWQIMKQVFLPSVASLLIPLAWFAYQIKGHVHHTEDQGDKAPAGANAILATGLGGLLLVPAFKSLTHLPPFIGVLLVLGIVWAVAELIHRKKGSELRKKYSAAEALSRTDTAGILFFFGILMAIGALETAGLLREAADALDHAIGNTDVIILLIGILSAVIDNVPLVAASMGMYPLSVYPPDHKLWEFMAYCAGTGGSILIIGSAAGVAVMGMEKINFGWYLRKVSLPALVGYLGGALVYLLLYSAAGKA